MAAASSSTTKLTSSGSRWRNLAIVMVVLLTMGGLAACSPDSGPLRQLGEATHLLPTYTPVPTPAPTRRPLPFFALTPTATPDFSRSAMVVLAPQASVPTATPPYADTLPAAILLPTDTPVPSPTPMPTAVIATGPTVRQAIELRRGPGLAYPVTGSMGPGAPIHPIGLLISGDWYLLDNGAWIPAEAVEGAPPAETLMLLLEPTPTATAPPTIEVTPATEQLLVPGQPPLEPPPTGPGELLPPDQQPPQGFG